MYTSTPEFKVGISLGMLGGMILMGLIVLVIPKPTDTPAPNIEEWQRSQRVEATGFLQDGNTVTVSLAISTKTDLSEKYQQLEIKEYIRTVIARYPTEDYKQMIKTFQTESIKYLGLDCNSLFMTVSITGLPDEVLQ